MASSRFSHAACVTFALFALLSVHARAGAQFVLPKDLDGDALIDEIEDANRNGVVDPGETDPLRADTDSGGEADGAEIHGGRDPLVKEDDLTFDRDGDGLTNGRELGLGTNPRDVDTDDDGFIDSADPFPLEKAYARDENRNGLPDEWEQQHALPSLKEPTVKASEQDTDKDGVSDLDEFKNKTDPTAVDSDRDGKNDGEELLAGRDPSHVSCLDARPSVPAFPDTEAHWSNPHIEVLQRTLILPDRIPLIEGYPMEGGSRFLPDRTISRFEFLKLALLGNCIALRATTDSVLFPDVPGADPAAQPGSLRIRVIATARHFGIVEGYPDGTFRPDAPVTRAEAVKILMVTGRFTDVERTREPKQFFDVPESAWFAKRVIMASALGIVEGYRGDGGFHPHAPITRAEAAKIIAVAMKNNPRINREKLPSPGTRF